MSDCKHTSFTSSVAVHRAENTQAGTVDYEATVTVTCVDCGLPFTFNGQRKARIEMEPLIETPVRPMARLLPE